MKKIIFMTLIILCLISPVLAEINITADEVGETYIKWSWNDGLTLTNLTVDGYNIKYFDKNDNHFILSDTNAGELHSIAVYTDSDSGYLAVNTTAKKESDSDKFMATITTWLFFLLGCFCIFIGLKEPILAYGGLVFGFLLITVALNNSFLIGTMGGLLIIASIFVAFRKE